MAALEMSMTEHIKGGKKSIEKKPRRIQTAANAESKYGYTATKH
jgi:hypothetical protein